MSSVQYLSIVSLFPQATWPQGRYSVTGATGQQGGAALQALIADPPPFDHQILALTRNTSSPKAQALSKHVSVQLISGDLDDCSAIFSSAGGPNSIWGIFLVTVPDMNKKGGIDKEEAQGCALVDAAIANGVKHLVFTSVDRGGPGRSDRNPTNIGHFITKHNIEQHLKQKAGGFGNDLDHLASCSLHGQPQTRVLLQNV